MTHSVHFTRLDLHAELRRALHGTPHFHGDSVRFDASDHEIVLSGVVGSYYQKQLAQESIRPVAGPRRIRNELDVAARPSR